MLAFIGGSGLYDMAAIENRDRVRPMTPWGEPSAALLRGEIADQEVLFLARHGVDHHLPPHRVNYRANIAALAMLGARAIVATTAVGGIRGATGDIVIPHQIIDYTWGREHTYFDGGQAHPEHVDFTEPFAEALRRALLEAAAASTINVTDGGVYAATQGPRLETAAEIDRLERDGCTIVGMTGMPEAALAREKSLPYANVSLIVNPAAGRAEAPITMTAIEQALREGMGTVERLLVALAGAWQPA